jgi:hypothetical protein
VPNSSDPEDFESTVALSGSDLKPVSFDEHEASNTTHDPGKAPFEFPSDDEPTGMLVGALPAGSLDGPPPFPFPARGAASKAPPPERPLLDTLPPPRPIAVAIVPTESVTTTVPSAGPAAKVPSRPPPVPTPPRSELAPLSTFVPADARPVAGSKRAPEKVTSMTNGGSTRPPQWVVAYLVLCALLTVIGLVVLFYERQWLGH